MDENRSWEDKKTLLDSSEVNVKIQVNDAYRSRYVGLNVSSKYQISNVMKRRSSKVLTKNQKFLFYNKNEGSKHITPTFSFTHC